MRTTIELPDSLLAQAKSKAALEGKSLRRFFVEAIENQLAPSGTRVRRTPPVIGEASGSRIGVLTPEQIDDAMFG